MSSIPNATEQRTSAYGRVVVLGVFTAIFCILCALMAWPFLSAFAWALALAVVAHPLHAWLERRVRNANLAAALAVALVIVLVAVPAGLVLENLRREALQAAEALRSGEAMQNVRSVLERYPQLGAVRQWVESELGRDTQIARTITTVGSVVGGSIRAVLDFLLTFFFLFFLFRDRREALNAVRKLIPVAEHEADEVFTRVGDTIHATIYGTLVVAAVQGALGGLMFRWLGLPSPLLWGVVMALLAIVPVLGAFVVWVPAAIYLLLAGEWGKAIILTVWGSVVIGLIDNLLYPVLVGTRLRLHTALVFVAVVGGLFVFGAAGLVLGPVILVVTQALIDLWRRRPA